MAKSTINFGNNAFGRIAFSPIALRHKGIRVYKEVQHSFCELTKEKKLCSTTRTEKFQPKKQTNENRKSSVHCKAGIC